jgi:hypothetical protein
LFSAQEATLTRKYIGFFRLIEACGAPGCPLCRCIEHDSRRLLGTLVDEHVNDPDTRRGLRTAWGLCNWHTWMLPELDVAATGAAIIYEDLLRVGRDRVDRLRRLGPKRSPSTLGRLRRLARDVGGVREPRSAGDYRRRPPCPVCVSTRDSEARYLDTIVRFSDDPEFTRAYGDSAGLCLPHAVAVVETGHDTPGAQRLLGETLKKWDARRTHLAGFVRKHEYRNTERISEQEAAARTAAFETLAGAKGVFGNDVHGGPRAG